MPPAAPAALTGDDDKSSGAAAGEARGTGECERERATPSAARAARERDVSERGGGATFPPTTGATLTRPDHAGMRLTPPAGDDSARTLALTASKGVQSKEPIIGPRASAQPLGISISGNQLASRRSNEALDRAADTDSRAALTTAPASRRAPTTAPASRRAATNARRARTSAPLLSGTGTALMTRPAGPSARTGLEDGWPRAATGETGLTAGETRPAATRTTEARATLAVAVASASTLTRPAGSAACDSAARTLSTRSLARPEACAVGGSANTTNANSTARAADPPPWTSLRGIPVIHQEHRLRKRDPFPRRPI
jgi:hypothetical protein